MQNILSNFGRLLLNLTDGDPFHGLGLPEPLKGRYSGYWSRRINQEHRLIYEVQEDVILLVSCFGHYT
jgi:toxin YoeB